jgi:hypothetical protein
MAWRRTRQKRPYRPKDGDSVSEEYLARANAETAVYDDLPAEWRELVREVGFDRAGGFLTLKPLAMRERRRRRSADRPPPAEQTMP